MIGILGLSHKSAPVQIREHFAFDAERSKALSAQICEDKYIDSVLVLSTCNRTEIYFRSIECSAHVAFGTIIKHLVQFTKATQCPREYFYTLEHKAAVKHLFRVVCSLDSMILGEYQIVSQIKSAYQNAESTGTISKVLTRLFNKALETGKHVRTQTTMSEGAFSISYAAVEKCLQHFPKLSNKKILLIGAGETGELVVRSLWKKGCEHITILNRTQQKAEELAKRYNASVVEYGKMEAAVAEADVVISAVNSPNAILTAKDITAGKTKLMIDLGVPRNMDAELGALETIQLYNVDDLQQVVVGNQEKKKELISVAEEIIDEKVDEFIVWLNGRNLSPAIQQIIHGVSELQKEELSLFAKKHTDEENKLLKEYSQHYSEKLVNNMIKNLKTLSADGRHSDYIKVINKLFSDNNE